MQNNQFHNPDTKKWTDHSNISQTPQTQSDYDTAVFQLKRFRRLNNSQRYWLGYEQIIRFEIPNNLMEVNSQIDEVKREMAEHDKCLYGPKIDPKIIERMFRFNRENNYSSKPQFEQELHSSPLETDNIYIDRPNLEPSCCCGFKCCWWN